MESEEERIPNIGELTGQYKPDHFLNFAHEQLAKGNNSMAIDYYIQYIENLSNPNDIKLIEQINLTKLIINLNDQIGGIDEQNTQAEVLKYFLAVLNKYPENALLLNACGVFFFSQGEYKVARKFLQSAAAMGYLPGEKNFLHLIWHLVPRWHFRMLNDKKRNESYKNAINKAVKAGFRYVYDIGTGCGLLSLIAATASPDVNVVAFEESEVLADIASEIFKKNNVKVKLIRENSNIAEKPTDHCNLIVTEIFDAGVFGEDCLKSIKNATNRFITEEKYKIIPAGVKLYVTGFECEEVTKKFRYIRNLPQLNFNFCLTENLSEPYDAEYLKNKKVKYVTDTVLFLHVNFYNGKQLEELLKPDSNCINDVELVCKEAGQIHALAVWFELNLDENISICTHPLNVNNQCWEQAIFHLLHPIIVTPGSLLKLKPRLINGQVKFEVLDHVPRCIGCCKASKGIISFLNDRKLVNSIIQAAASFERELNDLKIVDFNIFPLFGFLMAKKGATVYHVYHNEYDLNLLSLLLAANDIPTEKFIFIHQKSFEEHMTCVEPPNIIFTDHIKIDGSWSKDEFSLQTGSKLNCKLIPIKTVLKAQLISSPYLAFCNEVDDVNALNYKIFDEINQYSGSEHPNLQCFEHDKHSSIVTFNISDLEIIDFHAEGDIFKNGLCNAIYYWFEMQFTDDETNRFSTLDSTHYNKCCTLLNSFKRVCEGEKIMFHILRREGHLKIYCE